MHILLTTWVLFNIQIFLKLLIEIVQFILLYIHSNGEAQLGGCREGLIDSPGFWKKSFFLISPLMKLTHDAI